MKKKKSNKSAKHNATRRSQPHKTPKNITNNNLDASESTELGSSTGANKMKTMPPVNNGEEMLNESGSIDKATGNNSKSQKRTSTVRDKKLSFLANETVICSHKRPMPSLKELEELFNECDSIDSSTKINANTINALPVNICNSKETNRTSQKTKNKYASHIDDQKLCIHRRLMPSLKDLEEMFNESDSDGKATKNKLHGKILHPVTNCNSKTTKKMSQKLKKKLACHTDDQKLCSHRRLMPSLKDLEEIFNESDADNKPEKNELRANNIHPADSCNCKASSRLSQNLKKKLNFPSDDPNLCIHRRLMPSLKELEEMFYESASDDVSTKNKSDPKKSHTVNTCNSKSPKKTSQNFRKNLPSPTDIQKLCIHRRTMPSFKDLEEMFNEPDSDVETTKNKSSAKSSPSVDTSHSKSQKRQTSVSNKKITSPNDNNKKFINRRPMTSLRAQDETIKEAVSVSCQKQCNHRGTMPTLKELEEMFKESDSDDKTKENNAYYVKKLLAFNSCDCTSPKNNSQVLFSFPAFHIHRKPVTSIKHLEEMLNECDTKYNPKISKSYSKQNLPDNDFNLKVTSPILETKPPSSVDDQKQCVHSKPILLLKDSEERLNECDSKSNVDAAKNLKYSKKILPANTHDLKSPKRTFTILDQNHPTPSDDQNQYLPRIPFLSLKDLEESLDESDSDTSEDATINNSYVKKLLNNTQDSNSPMRTSPIVEKKVLSSNDSPKQYIHKRPILSLKDLEEALDESDSDTTDVATKEESYAKKIPPANTRDSISPKKTSAILENTPPSSIDSEKEYIYRTPVLSLKEFVGTLDESDSDNSDGITKNKSYVEKLPPANLKSPKKTSPIFKKLPSSTESQTQYILRRPKLSRKDLEDLQKELDVSVSDTSDDATKTKLYAKKLPSANTRDLKSPKRTSPILVKMLPSTESQIQSQYILRRPNLSRKDLEDLQKELDVSASDTSDDATNNKLYAKKIPPANTRDLKSPKRTSPILVKMLPSTESQPQSQYILRRPKLSRKDLEDLQKELDVSVSDTTIDATKNKSYTIKLPPANIQDLKSPKTTSSISVTMIPTFTESETQYMLSSFTESQTQYILRRPKLSRKDMEDLQKELDVSVSEITDEVTKNKSCTKKLPPANTRDLKSPKRTSPVSGKMLTSFTESQTQYILRRPKLSRKDMEDLQKELDVSVSEATDDVKKNKSCTKKLPPANIRDLKTPKRTSPILIKKVPSTESLTQYILRRPKLSRKDLEDLQKELDESVSETVDDVTKNKSCTKKLPTANTRDLKSPKRTSPVLVKMLPSSTENQTQYILRKPKLSRKDLEDLEKELDESVSDTTDDTTEEESYGNKLLPINTLDSKSPKKKSPILEKKLLFSIGSQKQYIHRKQILSLKDLVEALDASDSDTNKDATKNKTNTKKKTSANNRDSKRTSPNLEKKLHSSHDTQKQNIHRRPILSLKDLAEALNETDSDNVDDATKKKSYAKKLMPANNSRDSKTPKCHSPILKKKRSAIDSQNQYHHRRPIISLQNFKETLVESNYDTADGSTKKESCAGKLRPPNIRDLKSPEWTSPILDKKFGSSSDSQKQYIHRMSTLSLKDPEETLDVYESDYNSNDEVTIKQSGTNKSLPVNTRDSNVPKRTSPILNKKPPIDVQKLFINRTAMPSLNDLEEILNESDSDDDSIQNNTDYIKKIIAFNSCSCTSPKRSSEVLKNKLSPTNDDQKIYLNKKTMPLQMHIEDILIKSDFHKAPTKKKLYSKICPKKNCQFSKRKLLSSNSKRKGAKKKPILPNQLFKKANLIIKDLEKINLLLMNNQKKIILIQKYLQIITCT